MRAWEKELVRARVLRTVMARAKRDRTLNPAWGVAGSARVPLDQPPRPPLASRRGGLLWENALRAWLRRGR